MPTVEQRAAYAKHYKAKVNRAYRWRWPVLARERLASGSCGGWHLHFGPVHVWHVETHSRTRDAGLQWKGKTLLRSVRKLARG